MTTKKRIFCIAQLCLGFIALLWVVLYPFLGAVYHFKAQLIPYETLFDQKELFFSLPAEQQELLENKYEQIKRLSLATNAAEFFSQIPIYEWAWIILAIVIPIFLLLRIEGSNQLIWLLPALCLLSIFNENSRSNPSQTTLPTEAYLVSSYLNHPLSGTSKEQFAQLRKAWETFLIVEYAKEQPSEEIYEEQMARGLFLFKTEELKKKPIAALKYENSSKANLILYFFWNLFFAFYGRFRLDEEINQKACQKA